jgi:hypothetical protein
MFGFGRKKVSADEAAWAFVVDATSFVDGTFKQWCDDLKLGLKEAGIKPAVVRAITDRRDLRMIYLAGVCALHSLVVRELFEPATAKSIFSAIHARLGKPRGGSKKLAGLYLQFLAGITNEIAETTQQRHLAAGYLVLDLIELDKQAKMPLGEKAVMHGGVAFRLSRAFLGDHEQYWRQAHKKLKIAS